jgi:hypothetical protein
MPERHYTFFRLQLGNYMFPDTCWYGHFIVFWYVKLCPKFVRIFQLHPVFLVLESWRVEGSGYDHMLLASHGSMFWKWIMCVFLSLKEIYLLLLSKRESTLVVLRSGGNERVLGPQRGRICLEIQDEKIVFIWKHHQNIHKLCTWFQLKSIVSPHNDEPVSKLGSDLSFMAAIRNFDHVPCVGL